MQLVQNVNTDIFQYSCVISFHIDAVFEVLLLSHSVVKQLIVERGRLMFFKQHPNAAVFQTNVLSIPKTHDPKSEVRNWISYVCFLWQHFIFIILM